MALVPCKECGKQVSTKARACPNCGAPPPGAAQRAAWGASIVALAIGLTLALTAGATKREMASGDLLVLSVAVVAVAVTAVLAVVLKRRG